MDRRRDAPFVGASVTSWTPLLPTSIVAIALLIVSCSNEKVAVPSRISPLDHKSSHFAFRGYTEISDCAGVVDAETKLGSEVITAGFGEGTVNSDVFAAELIVSVYDSDMRATVACEKNGDIRYVAYWRNDGSIEASRALFHDISGRLDAQFGIPKLKSPPGGVGRIYRCDEYAYLSIGNVTDPPPEYPYTVLLQVELIPGKCKEL